MARRVTAPTLVIEADVDEATAMIRQLGERGEDVRPVAGKIRRIVLRSGRERFSREGPGWPDLAASTRARKRRQGQDPRIMRATGALYASLARESGPSQIDVRRPHEFRFGTELPYAVFHEAGEGVPRRRLSELSPRQRREIAKVIEEFLGRGRT